MKKHISTFVLILVIAGLLVGLVYTGKALISKDKEIAVLNQQNIDLNKSVEDLNKKIEELQDEKAENEKTEENTVVQIGSMPILDVEKVTNKKEGTTLTENIYDNNGIVSISVDNDTKSLSISLDAGIARQIYGYNGENDVHTIAALSEKILDVKILNSGKGANDLKLVILTESGKVKYVDVANILDKSYTIKSVDTIENVVRITGVSVVDSESGDVTYAVVGIKADSTAQIVEF